MAPSIVGTLPVQQSVDPNGSLSLDINLQVPPAKMAPKLSLAYHSASNTASTVGIGWALRGASMIERVPATIAQDGFRGVVNYDNNDRFALDGQRLVYIGNNEYRYELEQWSKIVAEGSAEDPTSWTEYLDDGSVRKFGNTSDSNIKAVGQNKTRVWAVSDFSDAFKNYLSYSYAVDTPNGAFYLSSIAYGGNQTLSMDHQRKLTFEYVPRPDVFTKYIGGSKITIDKHLSSISSSVNNTLAYKHVLTYDKAPLTGASRVAEVTLLDASGASVQPLKFDWVDGSPSVFEEPGEDSTVDFTGADVNMMPVDVHATGRNDVIIASRVTVSGVPRTRIATHLSDANGRLAVQASSVIDELPYHIGLFPLDINGDGRTDLVHISLARSTFTITVLLSTPDGYVPQASNTFEPESNAGFFRPGDFEGNGRIGLVYIYQTGGTNVKFVQFVSDGKDFTPLAAAAGPTGIAFADMQTVVGDMNGNGEEDVFIIAPRTKEGRRYCYISILESQDGVLKYKPDDELAASGESVSWSDSTTFQSYSVDEDGKTSILVAARAGATGVLVLNILRSTGRTLVPSPQAIQTNILYSGNLVVARASSTNSLDLINTFQGTGQNPRTEINVLRYDNGSFNALEGVRQGPSFALATWGDFRGIGRSDLLLNTQVQGRFNVKPMPCASSQPVDFIRGYTNGLGARVDVSYASLSDRTVYDTEAEGSTAPLAALNAMARNVSSALQLSTSTSARSRVSEMSHGRCEIVYFPSWVVKQVASTPYAPKPDIKEQTDYVYRNARISFDGRGWLGFEKITKTAKVLGSAESTWYNQSFPFLGQVDKTETKSKDGAMLQTRDYGWTDNLVSRSADKSHFVCMTSLNEVYYEGGSRAYSVNATYTHDDYGNITELSIVSPEVGTPALTTSSTFENTTSSSWVIGNKLTEVLSQAGQPLKQTRITYYPGTQTPKETRRWVAGDDWSVQAVEIDGAGNDIVVRGPGQAHHEFTFDATKSFVASSKIFVSDSEPPLVDTSSYSLEHGKPLSVADANGNGTSYVYDALGRLTETYQDDPVTGKTLVKKESFALSDTYGVQHVTEDRTEWGGDVWFKTVESLDGLEHVWRTERPRPDDSSSSTAPVAPWQKSRDYLQGSTPVFTTYKYDARSRVIEESSPPPTADLPPTVTSSQFKFASGLSECIETETAGDVVKTKSTQTQYLPNAERPSIDQLVRPFVVVSRDELGQRVDRTFDGLGRLVLLKDPSDVRLALTWDGLGRLVERRLSQAGSGSRKDLNYTKVIYDDVASTQSVQNVLTGSTIVTTFDFAKRPILLTSPDETKQTYVYDVGSDYSKGRLVSVSSESTGISYTYDYDVHGHLTKNELSLGAQTFTTSYTWSPLNQLLRIVNPDGTALDRVLYADGESVSHVELADGDGSVKASVAFSRFEDVYGRPLVCDFGNGISAQSTMHDNGALSSITMSNGGQAVHQQEWSIDAFNQISGYQRDHQGDQSASLLFTYDLSGQLKDTTVNDPAQGRNLQPQEFQYDTSGNLSAKGGKSFVNQGWQLSSVRKSDGSTDTTFAYSDDGNMLSKRDGAGNALQTMKYDCQGRLVELDDVRMVYDFAGRLVQRVQANGDKVFYPTQSYELEATSSGKNTHISYLVHGYRRASLRREDDGDAVVHYYHNDHLGSTVAVSDANGALLTQYTYDAFGQVFVDGDDIARYKFSGKELIEGIYYFGARFYDPSIGRFLTLDNYPVNLDDLSPCTFNMYAFSRNSPVNYIDVNGNAPWWQWVVNIALVAVGVALMFVPVVGPAATIAMGALSGAVLGAGMSGVAASASGASTKEWGIQLGLGAAFGAVGGAATAGVDVLLPAVKFSSQAVGKYVARAATRFIVNQAIGKGLDAAQIVANNAINDRPLGQGVLSVIPFASDTETPWYSYLMMGVEVGGGLASTAFKDTRMSGKYRMVEKKPGLANRLAGKARLAVRDSRPDYPLSQTALDVGSYRPKTSGSSVRYLGMTETTSL